DAGPRHLRNRQVAAAEHDRVRRRRDGQHEREARGKDGRDRQQQRRRVERRRERGDDGQERGGGREVARELREKDDQHADRQHEHDRRNALEPFELRADPRREARARDRRREGQAAAEKQQDAPRQALGLLPRQEETPALDAVRDQKQQQRAGERNRGIRQLQLRDEPVQQRTRDPQQRREPEH